MKNVAVICCIYNNLELAKECIEEAIKNSRILGQLILINNHGVDPRLSPWIEKLSENPLLNDFQLTIVDEGKNLGCHRGFNAGVKVLANDIEYVVKLDDDTFIRTPNWDGLMVTGLVKEPRAAYVSADIDPAAKQQNTYLDHEVDGMKFEISTNGIVGFSAVMFRRGDLAKWGPMRGAHEAPGDMGLYGGEESHYANCARADGKLVCHFKPVYCDHAKNELRHPDYPMWKWVYGFRRWTDLGMKEWLAQPQLVLQQYRKRLGEESRAQPMNRDFLLYVVSRIGALGDSKDSRKLLDLAQIDRLAMEPEVHTALTAASQTIDHRTHV